MNKLITALIPCVIFLGSVVFAEPKIIVKQEQYAESFRQFLSNVTENSIRNNDWNDDNWKIYRDKQLKYLPINNAHELRTAVTAALQDLGDHHSYLISDNISENPPENEPASFIIAEHNGIGIITINSYMVKNFDERSLLSEDMVKRFHTEFVSIQPYVSKGWIIDLSKNSGGSMLPMLAFISPFIKNQNLGGFYLYPHNKSPVKQTFTFNGKDFIFKDIYQSAMLSYDNQYQIGVIDLPIMVVIGNDTASSGEIVALALERQPNTTLIGQPTFGLATTNMYFSLLDNFGSYLLTVGHDLDKNDKPLLSERVYPGIFLNAEQEPIQQSVKLIEMRAP